MKGYGYHYSRCSGGGGLDFLVPLIGGAVAIGVAAAVAMFVLEILWWIVAFVAVIIVCGVAGFIWAVRTSPGGVRGLFAVRFQGPPLPPAEAAAVTRATPPAIVNHYHGNSVHIHGGSHEEAAALIRKALTER